MIARCLAATCSRFLATSRLPLFAAFSTVGPSSTKKYNFEDNLLPFKLNTLWNIPGRLKIIKARGRRRGFLVEDLVARKGSFRSLRKAAGRGMKGQGHRGNRKHPKFEAANQPLYIRLPKYGLKKRRFQYGYVNISQVTYAIAKGWIDPNELITIKTLVDAGVVKKPKFGLKLLARVFRKLLGQ